MLPYENEDGVKRNWLRARYEWKVFREHMKHQPKSHAPLLNIFVEFARSAPWLAGHLWFFTGVVLVVIAGVAYAAYY